MWAFRTVGPDHLIDVIPVVAVGVAVVVADYRELKLALGVLGREFPITNSQILFWD